MSSQAVVLKAAGLYSFPNQLNPQSTPQGALTQADNVIINRDNTIESMRGFNIYGNEMGSSPTTDVAKQIFTYKTRLLRHFNTSIQFDNGTGTFTSFTGSYSEPTEGIRIKQVESNSNLYFTESTGIKKIGVSDPTELSTSSIKNSGVPQSLDITLSLNQTEGFFNQESVAGYRAVWGITDANNNLILSAPSQRNIIYNPLTPLLINNFNNLLSILDTCTVSTGIHSQNYLTNFRVAQNSDPSTLRTNLIALAAELDSDIKTFTMASNIFNTTGTVSTSVTPTKITSITTTGIQIGQKVTCNVAGSTVSNITGSTTDGSTTLTVSTTGIQTGMTVTCSTNSIIASGTTVVSIGVGTVTLSHPASTTQTYSNGFTFTLSNPIQDDTVVTAVSGSDVTLSNPVIFSGTYTTGFNFSSVYAKQNSGESTFLTTIVVTNDPTSIFQISDNVKVIGLSPATLNTTTGIVQNITSNSISFNVSSDPGTYSTGTATVSRYNYESISEPSTLSSNPLTNELLTLQVYYDDIVTQLQAEPVAIVSDSSIFDSSNSTQSCTVNITTPIPQGITTSHFIQIYRTRSLSGSTGISLSDLDPGDEEGLVFEGNPTSTDLSNGFISVQDITPDSFIGANLYTNANSGEGIAQANNTPPLALDIALYKNYLFFANTISEHSKSISLLSVSDLVPNTSTVTITDGTTTNTYTFVAGVKQITTITTVADVAGSLNNKYFILSSANNSNTYYVWYNVNNAGTDPAISGAFGLEVKLSTGSTNTQVATKTLSELLKVNAFDTTLSGHTLTLTNSNTGISNSPVNHSTGFTFTVTQTGKGTDVANKKVVISTLETPAQQVDETSRSLISCINGNSSELIYAYYESGPTDVPGKILLKARILGSSAFHLTVNSTSTGNQFSPAIPTSGSTYISDNEVMPNRIFYSKQFQPEAVPLVNFFDVGPRDKKILRIIALRESLFVFKEEAIYRVSGNTAPFIQNLFDSSTNLNSPDTACVLNNQVYLLSTQGVAVCNDTGISIISRPIENSLVKLNNTQYANFYNASIGAAYESDRTYHLWTVTNFEDDHATQCFKYNTFTETWTRSTKGATCAIVNVNDDKLYIGAIDTNFIEKERKNFDRTDYSNREFTYTLASNSVNGFNIILPTLANTTVGDVISQVQYLTIKQFNRLLKRIDTDFGLTDKDYYSTLQANSGSNLRSLLGSLATKLDSDTGTQTKTYASSISTFTSSFPDTQDAFNEIVSLLNNDLGTRIKTYLTSSDTTSFEVIITELNNTNTSIKTQYAYPFILGPVTIYNHIDCVVKWAPETFGDPSMLKQITEATVMFESLSFDTATLSFSSDLNPSFRSIDFKGLGNGIYGSGIYGSGNFGGDAYSPPLRTYVPRDIQRCRYINVLFEHKIAREKFAIYGISLTANAISQRGYR